MILNQLKVRLRALFSKDRTEREMDEELRSHLEGEIQRNISYGMSPLEARNSAMRSFGGVEQFKAECRDASGVRVIEEIGQDLRYAARVLLKNPIFTLIAMGTLALGIGANTTIFSAVNSVLLEPPPYPEHDRMVLLWGNRIAVGDNRTPVSLTDIYDWREQNHVFEELTPYRSQRTMLSGLSGGSEPEVIPEALVGANYFTLMKTTPLLGRFFLSEEDQRGRGSVIVLSYGFWQSHFGGDPDAVGRTILLDAKPYTIVGVLRSDVASMPSALMPEPAQIYSLVAENHGDNLRGRRHLNVVGRMKQGVTIEQAQSEFNLIAHRLEQEHPENDKGFGVRLVSLREEMVGGVRPTLLLLSGAVLLVLLIVCANLGNLLLARASGRQKEINIRVTLGASRSRLVRQLLTESLLLSFMGGLAGLVLALAGVGLIRSLSSQIAPQLKGISIDSRSLIFTSVISLVTGLVFGLAPALQTTRGDLNSSLRENSRGGGAGAGQKRLRGALVVVEFAMAVILLIGAGLLIRSIMRLSDVAPGFNPDNVLTMSIWLPEAKYATRPSWAAFFDQAIERVEALPGVQSAGVVSVLPFGNNFDGRSILVEGQPNEPGRNPVPDLYIISPDYLRAMSIPILKGREITGQDTANSSNVTLVNEFMAEKLWPGEDPIGKRIRFNGPAETQPWRTVVGVVENVKHYGLDKDIPLQFYLPQAQYPNSGMALVIKATSDPTALEASVRREIKTIDKDQAVVDVATMRQLLWDSMSLRRFAMTLLGVFAGLALALAAIGVFGVISYSVAQRSHEIGVRIALGAQRRDVLRLILGEGLVMVLLGLVIGLPGAGALSRLIASLLFGVGPMDVMTFAGVALTLALVALLASFLPAIRATRIDPIIALRYE